MFQDLLRRLTGPASAPLNAIDSQLALAALLVRIARADGDYAPEEIQRIDRVLAGHGGLSEQGARDLRARAETLEAEAPDTVRFTRAIKDGVPYEERITVIEALWEVVLADGHRDDEENALLRMVSNFLGISDQDSALARRRVQKG